jgi:hypothetical protein
MLLDDTDNTLRITQVGTHDPDAIGDGRQIGVVAAPRRPLDAKDLDTLPHEILSEVRPVLATYPRDQRSFDSHGAILLSAVEESRHAADPQGILLA